jgi:hypothetical protein
VQAVGEKTGYFVGAGDIAELSVMAAAQLGERAERVIQTVLLDIANSNICPGRNKRLGAR